MKNKLKALIKRSKFIEESSKEIYLFLVENIPETQLNKLFGILTKAEEEAVKIQEDKNQNKSDLNKAYIQKIEDLFSVESKGLKKEEETDEKNEADNILSKLNQL